MQVQNLYMEIIPVTSANIDYQEVKNRHPDTVIVSYFYHNSNNIAQPYPRI